MDRTRHAGRTAIVTGAGSGIGCATAVQLATEGAFVVGFDLNEDGLGQTIDQLHEHGGSGVGIVGDITERAEVDRLVEEAERNGRIVEVLANVAGIMDFFLPVGEVDDETWTSVMAVNVTGPMMLCRRVVPAMSQARRGAIVNVASTAALGHVSAGVAYTASKHALIGLTRSVAYLYGQYGIRCNAVCPGGVATGIGATAAFRAPWVQEVVQSSIGRMRGLADPAQIGSVISWLASDEASNVNGAILTADGGFTAG